MDEGPWLDQNEVLYPPDGAVGIRQQIIDGCNDVHTRYRNLRRRVLDLLIYLQDFRLALFDFDGPDLQMLFSRGIFRPVRRIHRDDGSFVLELGNTNVYYRRLYFRILQGQLQVWRPRRNVAWMHEDHPNYLIPALAVDGYQAIVMHNRILYMIDQEQQQANDNLLNNPAFGQQINQLRNGLVTLIQLFQHLQQLYDLFDDDDPAQLRNECQNRLLEEWNLVTQFRNDIVVLQEHINEIIEQTPNALQLTVTPTCNLLQ